MDLARHAVTVLVALGGLAGTVGAKDKVPESPPIADADPEEATLARDTGLVIHDGKGHYIVFASPEPAKVKEGVARAVFYGDGTTFYRVHVNATGLDTRAGKLHFDWSITDERYGLVRGNSALYFREGVYTMSCRDEQNRTQLTPLPPVEARSLLEKAAFKGRRMDRMAYALGRDGTTYYYVDVANASRDSTDYRVYVGKRGAMKQLKLTDQAADSNGRVFTSKAGSLRVVMPSSLIWTPRPKKETALTVIPVDSNLELVYSELGVYAGKKFGVPCDDM